MTKWGPVFLGFILAVIVKSFFAHYEFIGLLLVGFIVGYLCREGAISGMWNAAVAGAFGTIVSAIVLGYLIYYAIVMGIAGGVGGLISSKK